MSMYYTFRKYQELKPSVKPLQVFTEMNFLEIQFKFITKAKAMASEYLITETVFSTRT